MTGAGGCMACDSNDERAAALRRRTARGGSGWKESARARARCENERQTENTIGTGTGARREREETGKKRRKEGEA